MTPEKPKPHLGQGPWTDLQLLLRALRDAGPDAAKEVTLMISPPRPPDVISSTPAGKKNSGCAISTG